MPRSKLIDSPETLWALALEYFAKVDANPWYKHELIKSGDLAGLIIQVPLKIPYTWAGLEVHCHRAGYNVNLDEFKSNRRGTYTAFANVINEINKVLYDQKIVGASVGSFNPHIVSAELGLATKTITEVKDTTEEIDYTRLSDSALEEIANAKKQVFDDDDDLF